MADKTLKVCLTNRGEDSETPWAQDLGAAPGVKGGRRVRLVNVPFLHAKPTWGDVIVVAPKDGQLTWDRDGVAWKQIGTRIEEDGGRWAMIVDYSPHEAKDSGFAALAKACGENDVVCEGAWDPQGSMPGRAYLAVKIDTTADAVMASLRALELPCELTQIHPARVVETKAKPKAKKPKPKPKAKAKAKAKPKRR